jgi:hypothetical protein
LIFGLFVLKLTGTFDNGDKMAVQNWNSVMSSAAQEAGLKGHNYLGDSAITAFRRYLTEKYKIKENLRYSDILKEARLWWSIQACGFK